MLARCNFLRMQTRVFPISTIALAHRWWVQLLLCTVLYFPSQLYAQSEACAALENRLEILLEKSSKDDARWVKKTLMPALCTSYDSEQKVNKVDSMVSIMEGHRSSISGDIKNYLRTVHALCSSSEQHRWVEWHGFVDRMWLTRKNRKTAKAFLAISPDLIDQNILMSAGNHWWQLDSATWNLAWMKDAPCLTFENSDLSARKKDDHFTLQNTTGVWDVRDEKCQIEPTKVTWEGTSFSAAANYALLPATSLDLKNNVLRVSNASMHSELSAKPLLGDFTAKLESVKDSASKSYPRFKCTDNQVILNDFFPQMRYSGGVQFKGSQILGIRNADEPARIEIHQADTALMEFSGLEFLLSSRGWSCAHAKFVMHYANDTLSHPDVQVRFNKNRNQITVYRQEKGLGQQPFADGYHQLEWDVPGLLWEVNSTRLKIGSAIDGGSALAQFASTNYFEQRSFDALQGQDPTNPVVEVYRFTKSTGRNGFMTEDFARHIRLSEVQARVMLMQLANSGYVQVNPETLWCTVTPKLRNHILCKTGRKDYDVMRFNSTPINGVNAEWSLLNGHFKINGIDQIQLSTAKDVTLFPANGEIVVSKNRDFTFDGRIEAGNIEMNGDGLSFNYKEFSIDFNSIEAVRLSVYNEEELTNRGTPRKHWLQSQLEGVSGSLSIDYPTNRSGRRSELHPDFPIFESTKTSYVYYDRFDLFEGAYDRDRFHYVVEPFQMKKLDNLTKKNFQLKGTLISAGILPDLEEPLRVMDDYYLGLSARSDNDGMEVYTDAATFTNDIELNGRGLQGSGSIDFLTAHVESLALTMLPDSIVGRAEKMENVADKRRNTAAMSGSNGFIVFRPKDRELDLISNDEPLDFYNNEARLTGNCTVTDTKFTGRGALSFKDAALLSNQFRFQQVNVKSPSAEFQLKGTRNRVPAFQTDDVQCDVDFEARLGEFTPNSGETKIELPIQQYICFMDRFRWYMDDDEIDLLSNRMEQDLPFDFSENRAISNFISTHPDQDSLHFLSSSATYRIGDDLLECKGVQSIAVADSRIIPDSSNVIIRPQAKMDDLQNAQIVTNATTKFHYLDSAWIHIYGRYAFEGAGFYNYKSVDGKTERILLNELTVDDSLRTIGRGDIIARDGFLLSPAFAFAGEVNMTSTEPFLHFSGGAKMTKECNRIQSSWIAFTGFMNPNAIAIPVSEFPKDTDGDPLAYGLMASSRPPFTMYAAFLDPKGDESDMEVLKGDGELRYVDERYVYSTLNKIENPSSAEPKIDIRPSNCDLKGTGEMNLPLNFELIDQSFVGTFEINARRQYVFRGSLKLDFKFNQDLFDRMALQIPSWEPSEPINIPETNYEQALETWLGEKESKKLINDLAFTGTLKNIPKSMRNSIIFTQVELIWDPDLEEFISSNNFALASLGNAKVFQKFPGKIMLRRSRSKDSFTIYMHGDEQNWYFFKYTKNTLNCLTPDKIFSGLIADTKMKKREVKAKDGRKFTYKYIVSKKWRNDLVDEYREFD